MAKNGNRINGGNDENQFIELRFAEFKRLPKKELLDKLDKTALSKRERGLIHSILKDAPIVWTSKDRSTTIRRGANVDFIVSHKCIGGVIESNYENYDDALNIAAWICDESNKRVTDI